MDWISPSSASVGSLDVSHFMPGAWPEALPEAYTQKRKRITESDVDVSSEPVGKAPRKRPCFFPAGSRDNIFSHSEEVDHRRAFEITAAVKHQSRDYGSRYILSRSGKFGAESTRHFAPTARARKVAFDYPQVRRYRATTPESLSPEADHLNPSATPRVVRVDGTVLSRRESDSYQERESAPTSVSRLLTPPMDDLNLPATPRSQPEARETRDKQSFVDKIRFMWFGSGTVKYPKLAAQPERLGPIVSEKKDDETALDRARRLKPIRSELNLRRQHLPSPSTQSTSEPESDTTDDGGESDAVSDEFDPKWVVLRNSVLRNPASAADASTDATLQTVKFPSTNTVLQRATARFTPPPVRERGATNSTSEQSSMSAPLTPEKNVYPRDDVLIIEDLDTNLTDSPPAHEINVDKLVPRHPLDAMAQRMSEMPETLNVDFANLQMHDTPKARTHSTEKLRRVTQARLRREKALEDALNQFELVPLTQQWEQRVRQAVRQGAGTYAASDFARVVPQYSTYAGQDNWLNDEVINGYLNLIVAHGKKNDCPDQTPSFHAFNSFFYKNLSTKGPESVLRWSKRPKINGTNLWNVDKVFIPINSGAHWTLAVVAPKQKTITHYNSMRSARLGIDACEHIKGWVGKELGSAFKDEEWKLEVKGESPQQTNSDDCGVFTITSARQIMLGFTPMSYQADQMSLQRRRIVAELVNGGLLRSKVEDDEDGE